ncbi:MAG: hypothetical protein J6L64_00440 [Opitutales bacterium]|nr:hypothetical protein [Opitutales bacterium]
MSSETLNWQDFISDWSFVSGGESPPDGLDASVVPTVTRASDGLFEITTISFGFSGTAPYNQQKFTAEFSFSVSSVANFYEVSVSSDDTATVRLGGNDFVSSRLNVPDIASSAWNGTASAIPAVSGTFETIGGPYSLSVTVTLKRLVGAEWSVSGEWSESGIYQVKTATLSFSGTARSDTQGFSWNSLPINIDGGNWVDISIEADDEATVSVGDHMVTARLNNPETYASDWMEEAPTSFPVTVSYRNAGGPYSLSVTVTVKRSLREVFFETPRNTPDELLQIPPLDDSTLKQKRETRTVFGCMEVAYIKGRKKTNTSSGGGTNSTESADAQFVELPDNCTGDISKHNKLFCADTGLLPVNGNTTRVCEVFVQFSDGEIIWKEFTLKYPTGESAREITEEEFKTVLRDAGESEENIERELINYENYPYYDGHYYVVTVCPTDVVLGHLYFWETEFPEEKSGLFLEIGLDTTHRPTTPKQLDKYNRWTDKAYYAATFADEIIAGAQDDEEWNVGVLTWVCPVRWSKQEPTKEEGEPNTSFASDGELADRIQTMKFKRPVPPPPLLTVHVQKDFNVK